MPPMVNRIPTVARIPKGDSTPKPHTKESCSVIIPATQTAIALFRMHDDTEIELVIQGWEYLPKNGSTVVAEAVVIWENALVLATGIDCKGFILQDQAQPRLIINTDPDIDLASVNKLMGDISKTSLLRDTGNPFAEVADELLRREMDKAEADSGFGKAGVAGWDFNPLGMSRLDLKADPPVNEPADNDAEEEKECFEVCAQDAKRYDDLLEKISHLMPDRYDGDGTMEEAVFEWLNDLVSKDIYRWRFARGVVGLSDITEPVFLLRAKDMYATHGILGYMKRLAEAGLDEQCDEVNKALNEFEKWRSKNEFELKRPDHRHVPNPYM